jgi:PII-like signaling protein
MKLTGMVSLIRIYIGEGDAYEGRRPLFGAIVDEARNQGLSGATVLRGPLAVTAHRAGSTRRRYFGSQRIFLRLSRSSTRTRESMHFYPC